MLQDTMNSLTKRFLLRVALYGITALTIFVVAMLSHVLWTFSMSISKLYIGGQVDGVMALGSVCVVLIILIIGLVWWCYHSVQRIRHKIREN
jgi:hypothetical protein